VIRERYAVAPQRVSVIPNGIDADVYRRVQAPEVLRNRGVDPTVPYVLFLGRITRQKGIRHFLAAARRLPATVQIVLCAAGADTPELVAEVAGSIAELREQRGGERVVWIDSMIPRPEAIALLAHAAVFCCPSIYEPFGIINLEAMACETPVVASAVGGIPDVVVPGETGELVAFAPTSPDDSEPADPERFAADLAAAIGGLLDDRERRRRYGAAGRRRVTTEFAWPAVAHKTYALYEQVVGSSREVVPS
jgi:glycosyltransferase involved in cell wall biosynthesis